MLQIHKPSVFVGMHPLTSFPYLTITRDKIKTERYTQFLRNVLNAIWGHQQVIIKYPQKCYTYMRVDAIHVSFGQKIKQADNTYTFDDFVELCRKIVKF